MPLPQGPGGFPASLHGEGEGVCVCMKNCGRVFVFASMLLLQLQAPSAHLRLCSCTGMGHSQQQMPADTDGQTETQARGLPHLPHVRRQGEAAGVWFCPAKGGTWNLLATICLEHGLPAPCLNTQHCWRITLVSDHDPAYMQNAGHA